MTEQNYIAACYCRLSKEDEIDGSSISIETQQKILGDYCKRNHFLIYDYYIDDYVIIGISKENLVKSRVSALIPFSFFERASTNSYLKVKIQ